VSCFNNFFMVFVKSIAVCLSWFLGHAIHYFQFFSLSCLIASILRPFFSAIQFLVLFFCMVVEKT